MLSLVLTMDDYDDLHNVVGTINVMTAEGVEVLANPDDFTTAVWQTLDGGGKAVLDMDIIGQQNTVEVEVTC